MNAAVWVVQPPRPEIEALALALDIPPAIARVLVNRKILTEEAARGFLFGGLSGVHDPYLMKGMDKAVARIGEAIARGERILIFTGSNAMAIEVSRRFLVPTILSHTRKRERLAVLEAFAKGQFTVLVANRVLDEGVDVPEAKVAVVIGGQ